MFDLELLVSSHSQIVRQRFHLYHFKVVIDSKIGQTKFIAFLEGIFEFEEIECKQECDMFSLRIQFTSCLNIEKIVIELHSLTGIQLKEWLPLFYLPIDPLQHVRNMIRVGTFDDKISKISIADLSHDLVQLPFLACIILIAILCFSFIVVLSQHVFQDFTDCLDLSLANYYWLLGDRSILLYSLLLGYPDLLPELFLYDFELVPFLFLGLLFGGRFAWTLGTVLDYCSGQLALAKRGFQEIVLFLHG